MAIRFRNSGKKQRVKTGRIEVSAKSTATIECGFAPVHIAVTIVRNGTARSNHVYDSRISTTTVAKMGQDTNDTVGLPTKASDLFTSDGKGFKINNGYNYGGWYFYYEAIGEFSAGDNGMKEE